jgi:eukaryotic-like serine/threonine-protein kinase
VHLGGWTGLDELQSEDPRRIGPYRLEERLGSGGMGRVYLARSPGGRRVAIKVIRPELAEDTDFRARFAREVSAARKVSGIFTSSVVDADLDGPMPWLATSYIAGPSLSDAVAARGPLSERIVLRLAAGLAEGLCAIHAAGVVHRDLKPSNVLLADDGPRLIDFGISRSMEAAALTQTGMVVGSPGFMSPEQTQGREVGPPSDIFSLGAVLTFAATGEGPFGHGTTVALLYRVVSSPPNTAGLPGDLRLLAEDCLAKDPRQRPTAAQLLAWLSGSPSAAYPPPAPAYPATELAAGPVAGQVVGPVAPRGDAQERVPTASRPELRAVYDEPPAHSPVRQDRLPAMPESRFDRPMASPVPPWDSRAVAPARRRPARRSWLIAVAAAAVLISAGAGALVAGKIGAGHGTAPASPGASGQAGSAGPTTSSAANATSPASSAQPPGRAAMASLGTYLARSASVRSTIQSAIDGVRGCSESPAAGEATLQHAIDTRQDILNALPSLSVSGLPRGTELVSTLTTTMQDSVTADKDYQSWMKDFASSGSPCGSDPSQDPNYADAVNVSNATTTAKSAFLAIWNPMAPRYGQQVYSNTGF